MFFRSLYLETIGLWVGQVQWVLEQAWRRQLTMDACLRVPGLSLSLCVWPANASGSYLPMPGFVLCLTGKAQWPAWQGCQGLQLHLLLKGPLVFLTLSRSAGLTTTKLYGSQLSYIFSKNSNFLFGFTTYLSFSWYLNYRAKLKGRKGPQVFFFLAATLSQIYKLCVQADITTFQGSQERNGRKSSLGYVDQMGV